MDNLKNRTVGSIVTDDFRAAELFRNAGIDFCCGGNQLFSEACKEKNLDADQLEDRLQALSETPADGTHSFKDWKLDFLCDYIENTHHQTVQRLLPQLSGYTRKIAEVHGEHHPELLEIAGLFADLAAELQQHLAKEEEVLFPAIRTVLKENSAEAKATIVSEINRMTGEHEFAGGAMDRINQLSGRYRVPEDGCNTYAVTYRLLEQFEDDLHVHVHLENNILYPKALSLSL